MARAFKAVTFMVLVFATVVVFAEDHDVGGDDTKWQRPTDLDFYSKWAAGKTFHVGDELEFEFDHERHDVAIVTKDAYENCIKDSPIKVTTISPAKIKLDTTGPQYFICTMADHCRWGQKLEINVVGAGGAATPGKGGAGGSATQAPGAGPSAGGGATQAPGASPSAGGGATEAPGASPSAEGSSPPTTPSETKPSGSGETTKPSGSGETTKPPAESAASSLAGATFLAVFVFAVVALF